MTETDKMLRGEPYNSRHPELINLYRKARRFMHAYNNLIDATYDERISLLREAFKNAADGVWIEAPFFCDYASFISIGENTFINTNCVFQDNNLISIGDNCLIGPGVHIYTASHPVMPEERTDTSGDQQLYKTFTKPVTIGNNVWIGGQTVILPGVTIGNGVTIGAGSVVTKSLPDRVVAFGNPCTIVKHL
jgi:maltose O-acetyltransferase